MKELIIQPDRHLHAAVASSGLHGLRAEGIGQTLKLLERDCRVRWHEEGESVPLEVIPLDIKLLHFFHVLDLLDQIPGVRKNSTHRFGGHGIPLLHETQEENIIYHKKQILSSPNTKIWLKIQQINN